MKTACFVLKITALVLSVAAVVCAVVAYWDKIVDLFYGIADKMEEKKADCCIPSEFEDFEEEPEA